jgi:hypothetical protein
MYIKISHFIQVNLQQIYIKNRNSLCINKAVKITQIHIN